MEMVLLPGAIWGAVLTSHRGEAVVGMSQKLCKAGGF